MAIGSHSPGMGATVAQVESHVQLFTNVKEAFKAKFIVVASTTAVNEDKIPDKFTSQFFVRSNVRIQRRRLMIHLACNQVHGCFTLDLFSPTLAQRDFPNAFSEGDPVHYNLGRKTFARLMLQRIAHASHDFSLQV